MIMACKNCKELPTVEKMFIGWGVACDCYAPTGAECDAPEPVHNTETGKTRDDAITKWNKNWGEVNNAS